MIAIYHVEYEIPFRKHPQGSDFQTDDPVTCEQFLMELLEKEFKIRSVKHEGVTLPVRELDKMLNTAAGMLAARHLSASLGMDYEEVHHRFGFSS